MPSATTLGGFHLSNKTAAFPMTTFLLSTAHSQLYTEFLLPVVKICELMTTTLAYSITTLEPTASLASESK